MFSVRTADPDLILAGFRRCIDEVETRCRNIDRLIEDHTLLLVRDVAITAAILFAFNRAVPVKTDHLDPRACSDRFTFGIHRHYRNPEPFAAVDIVLGQLCTEVNLLRMDRKRFGAVHRATVLIGDGYIRVTLEQSFVLPFRMCRECHGGLAVLIRRAFVQIVTQESSSVLGLDGEIISVESLRAKDLADHAELHFIPAVSRRRPEEIHG